MQQWSLWPFIGRGQNSDKWIRHFVKIVVSQFHILLKLTLPWILQTAEFLTQFVTLIRQIDTRDLYFGTLLNTTINRRVFQVF